MSSSVAEDDRTERDRADAAALDADTSLSVRAERPMSWHRRLGVSWSSGSLPIVLILLVGMALGPGWLAVLNTSVLDAIAPALPVALAALGAQLALTLPTRRSTRDDLRFTVACLEAAVTAVVVGIGVWWLLPDLTGSGIPGWLIPVAAGICAASSAALPSDSTSATASSMDVRQLDVLLPVLVEGVLLAWIREESALGALRLTAEAAGIALVIGIAAWLLLSGKSRETEQRIYGASALLLLGGIADYLALSALLAGIVAGIFWRFAGGQAAEALRKGIAHVQHPLVVLMLVVAGARVEMNGAVLSMVIAYPVLRAAAKLGGAWLGRRVVTMKLPEDLGPVLIAPGVFGIALAVNVAPVLRAHGGWLMAIVVLGSIASQIVASWSSAEPHA